MNDTVVIGLSISFVLIVLTVLIMNNYNNTVKLERRIDDLHS
jgi:low affinity Fe/Cu permease